MRRSQRAPLWVLVYFVLVLAPIVILFLQPRPAGREFWREFSVALGFFGLSLIGFQFIPPARLPFMSDVFPMDTLYRFHHQLSVLSFALVLAHPLILFLNNPFTIGLLNVFTAPGRARAGVTALVALIVLVVTSIRRQWLSIRYEGWRALHDVLAVAAVVLAFVHVFGVGYHSGTAAQRVVWAVLGVVWAGMILYIRVIKPRSLAARPYEVRRVIQERGASWTLALEPVGHPGLRFRPGQFAWLTIRRSPFAIREHPFSFSSSAERPETIEFTIKELGDFTSTVGETLPGERVYVDGPYGVFGVDEYDTPGFVFLAGGVGATPIMSMLRTLADRGDERPLLLLYGNPTWESITYREEIESLQERLNLQVVHVLERPPEDWEGERGFMNAKMLDRYIPKDRASRVYLVCGPLPMIDAVESALAKLDVPHNRVHSERFEMA